MNVAIEHNTLLQVLTAFSKKQETLIFTIFGEDRNPYIVFTGASKKIIHCDFGSGQYEISFFANIVSNNLLTINEKIILSYIYKFDDEPEDGIIYW